jgi:hypothetical protein
MTPKKIKITYTDAGENIVLGTLRYVKGEYDFEFSQERDADFVFHTYAEIAERFAKTLLQGDVVLEILLMISRSTGIIFPNCKTITSS